MSVLGIPLSFLKSGESGLITRIGGNDEMRRHLEDLGFIAGTPVSVVSRMGGNVICSVMESRVAISKELAQKIMV